MNFSQHSPEFSGELKDLLQVYSPYPYPPKGKYLNELYLWKMDNEKYVCIYFHSILGNETNGMTEIHEFESLEDAQKLFEEIKEVINES